MKKRKIKIKKGCSYEQMAYGGQTNYALDIRTGMTESGKTGMGSQPDYADIRTTIKEVPRETANIEAEAGETIVTPGEDGMQHFKVGGDRHHKGGTPLLVPPGSFVFSDTKKMRIGGPVLEMFGKPADTDKKYTPAQLAKQYDLNKYQAMLDDPASDHFQKNTAKMMLENNGKKLGQLALVQEAKKGFPNGVPAIAQPYIMGAEMSAPDFNTMSGEREMATGGPVAPDDIDVQQSPVNYGWTGPDKVNMLTTLMNAASIKKYTPWAPQVDLVTPEFTYYDPTRAIGAVAEQTAQAQQANAMLAGPGSRYQNSAIQGKGMEAVANVAGQYAERNVGIGNQAAGIQADTANKQAMFNAERAKGLYDANTIASQQYDNARRDARTSIAQQYGQGWNNASTMYNMNKTTSPYYMIDPQSGKLKFHTPASYQSWLKETKGSGDGEDLKTLIDQYYQQLKGKFPSDAEARKAAAEAGLNYYNKLKLHRTTNTIKTGLGTTRTTGWSDD